MKTAEDHVLDIHGDNLPPDVLSEIVKHVKDYARDVADQALKDASENAMTYLRRRTSGCRIMVNKQSILNTEIQLP